MQKSDSNGNAQTGVDLNPGRRAFILITLFAALSITCIFFIAAFIGFQPDQLSLSDRYFPSPTASRTPTLTLTPTPNMTATHRVIQATSTSQAIQTTIANANIKWSTLMLDSFNSNDNLWRLGEDDDGYANITRTIDDGVYKWDATSKKGFISYERAVTKSVGDFLLSVEVQKLRGTSSSDYGLIFRRNTSNNFYYFGIGDNGYHVLLNYNDKWIDIIEWTPTSAIQPASPNRLTVIGKGPNFTFLINDQIVATATVDRISQGITGLAIQIHSPDRHAVIEFDNFELREP